MSIDSLDAEVRSLMPPTDFSRREFLTTSVIAGFSHRETAPKEGWQRLRTWFQQNGVA